MHRPIYALSAGLLVITLWLHTLSPSVSEAAPTPINTASASDIVTQYTAYLPLVPRPPRSLFLENGDFEQGDTYWRFERARVATDAASAHSGSHYAQLGRFSGFQEIIKQRITVPVDKPYLIYWDRTTSKREQCGLDQGLITIDLTPDGSSYTAVAVKQLIFDFCLGHDRAWQRQSIDLSAHAGQYLELTFEMGTYRVNAAAFPSYWDVDDVSFQATP